MDTLMGFEGGEQLQKNIANKEDNNQKNPKNIG